MPLIEIKDIDYFLAIVEFGSISKAAERLYISQPALTKYVRNLENRLETELFVHGSRPFMLTPAGELYYNYAREIVTQRNNLERSLERVRLDEYENIRIGFASTGLRDYVIKSVRQIQSQNDKLRLICSDMNSQEIERCILTDKLDIGFITLPALGTGFNAQMMHEEDILLAVPASHPLSVTGSPFSAAEFPTVDLGLFRYEQFVLRESGSRFRTNCNKLFAMAHFKPDVMLTARNNFSCMEYAEMWNLCTLTTKSFIHNTENHNSMRFFTAGPCPQKIYAGFITKKDCAISLSVSDLVKRIAYNIAEDQ